MSWVINFYRSTVGKKMVMAITGFFLVGFLVGHMLGNLQVYLGQEAFNHYAAALHSLGGALWMVRFVLLASLILHIWSSFLLWRTSSAARPVDYAKWTPDASSYASRTMRWSGPIIGTYLVYHILHLTVGTAHSAFDPQNVYANVVLGFQNRIVSAVYIAAMLLLMLHLYHGVWSFMQSLGINHARYNQWRKNLALVLCIAVGIGFLMVPAGVLLGLVKL